MNCNRFSHPLRCRSHCRSRIATICEREAIGSGRLSTSSVSGRRHTNPAPRSCATSFLFSVIRRDFDQELGLYFIAMNCAGADEEDWRKRLALTGQWKTPPTPMYAAGGSSSSIPPSDTMESTVPSEPLSQFRTTTLPNQGRSDPALPIAAVVDYTAALQEAYLRGAQAAAALAAGTNPGAESMPHPTGFPLSGVPNPLLHLSSSNAIGGPSTTLQAQQLRRDQLDETIPSSETTTAASSTTMIASSAAPFPFVTPIPSPNSLPSTQPLHSSSAGALYQTTMPLQPQSLSHLMDRKPEQAHASQTVPPKPFPYPPRAMSMPNMGFNLEEEKRQKRLARNRASARLRRMRKKNLVRSCLA